MIGTTLLDRYQILAEVGSGGMGIVYRAHDPLLDRDVAIKMLSHPELGAQSRLRLLNEARAAARINHPNIVSIYDVVESGEESFIIMEMVEGKPLRIKEALPLSETLAIALQVCSALEKAHAQGIIHGDLKPENILLTSNQVIKLMDFGMARSKDTSASPQEGTIEGTLSYIAPELIRGEEPSFQSDLYALGVILYELTVGRPPFTSDNAILLLSQHMNEPVQSPRSLNLYIPSELDTLIVGLLSKQPDQRPQNAKVVLETLNDIARGRVPWGFPSAPSTLHNLPPQLSNFIGRQKEFRTRWCGKNSPGSTSCPRDAG